MIGGTAAGAGNRIDSAGIGVSLDRVPPPAGSGNAILGNLIDSSYGSAITLVDGHGIGIDLKADGMTANDPCDADAGPNGLQNFPVITLVKAGPGTTTINGTLDAAPGTAYRLEFFADNFEEIDEAFLGSTMVTTDAACQASFEVTFPVSVTSAAQITATATDDHNNSSEFSQPVGVQTQFFTVTPCRVADTRDPPGPSGGPPLTWGENRTFPVAGICGIPPTARAVAIVGAAFEPTAWGDLLLYPHSQNYNQLASFVNFRPGITQSNFGIVPLGIDGMMNVHCNLDNWAGITHFFFDVYGYYQ